jgi:malate dehydrogenase
MASPKRVLITGAAGQIGYSIVPMICSGEFLGHDQPIIIHLLDISFMADKLQGVKLEIDDCAFPLVKGVVATTDVKEAFTGVDYAFMVGAFPRKDGMERKDLLAKNAAIFKEQGKALNDYSSKTVKVLVVGNPANTNCMIAQSCAADLPKENFTAMTRLDHNRATSFVAHKAGVTVADVKNVTIWGNHSSTQYPEISTATIAGKKASEVITDLAWLEGEFITSVQKRGAVIIQARGGFSSAMSAAYAAVDHMRDWVRGTKAGETVSMGVPSDGSYGIPAGVVYSFPCTCKDGKYQIVQGITISEFSRGKMDLTYKELKEERDVAAELLGLH